MVLGFLKSGIGILQELGLDLEVRIESGLTDILDFFQAISSSYGVHFLWSWT